MNPTTAAPKPTLSALRPTLHSAVGRPAPRACSVLTHGLGLGFTSGAIRRYTIRTAPDPALRGVAQNLPLWSALTSSAARKVAGSRSSVGRAALRREVAARLVGRLVLPAVIPEKDMIQPKASAGDGPAGQDGNGAPGGAAIRKPAFTQRRVVSARHAMAVIGTGFIRGTSLGFEGDYVNELNLAAETGTSPVAARANLQALEAMGWLRCTKRQKGSASKHKLARLPKRVETASAPFLGVIELLGDRTILETSSSPDEDQDAPLDEVDEDLAAVLADQPDDAYAVQVLQSARHAAWTYSRPAAKADRTTGPDAPADLVTRDWVYLWAVATGAVPATMGLSARECTSARKDLRLAQVGPTHPGTLTEQLDRVAARTGATDRYRAAWADRNEARAKRTKSVRTIQTAAGRNQTGPVRLKVVLDRVAGSVPAVPVDGPTKAVLMDWVATVRTAVRFELEGGPVVDGGPAKLPSWTGSPDLLRDGLADRLTAAGYTTDQAAALSRAAVAA